MTTISDINNVPHSGDLRADSLLDKIIANWNYLLPTRTTLYFTFDCSLGSVIDQATSEVLTAFNVSQQSAATSILGYVASLTGLSFVETPSGTSADFHFGAINISGATTAGLCSSTSSYSYTTGEVLTRFSAEAYIYLDNVEFVSNNTPIFGTSGYETLLHEIGHALGLDHPFEGVYPLSAAQDNTNNTVMSYTHAGDFKSTFQSYDLLALTWIYGNDGLAGNYGFNSYQGPSLTPGVGADTTAPSVTTFSPADESLSVTLGSNIVLTFNEAISRGTGNIVLKNAAATIIATYDAATSGNLSISGSTLTINPTADLAYGTGYTVEFATGSIKDMAGNNYAGTTSYNFTTVAAPDATAPSVTTFSPANEATGVAIGSNIVVTFSETIAKGTGNVVLKNAAGTVMATYNAATSSNLSISGSTLTINPTADLSYSTGYKVEFAAGSIKDIAGNSYAGTSSYNFTTAAAPDTTAPSVTAFSPADEATGIAIDSNIVVTFNEAITRGTGNIVLKNAAGTVMATYDAATSSNLSLNGSTLTINPTADLINNTGYKVEFVIGSIKDIAGNNFAGTSVYNFMTVAKATANHTGTSGNDIFTGTAENDNFDGGNGIDTSVFSGSLANYALTKSGSSYIVLPKSGTDGTDTHTNVEYLKFADRTVNLTVQDIAAAAPEADVQRIEELYVAFFNRVPDADGLAYWIGQMNAGQSINQIAESFYNAGIQFSSLTGFSSTMSNDDFVNVIYRNVLGRSEGGDTGGLTYWSGALANHTETHGSLVSTILSSAHTYKGDATWGWVADLLDNKITVANQFAVDWGLNYNTPNESITQGMAIAAAVTSTSTAAAIALIGVSSTDMQMA